ncbi:MAG: ABC-type transport auxiliary lipoprotein family protein [Pseudomonadota bacterium]|jgi:cholesterol transport system auxiliary component|nr:ABC-type transport auxiliary lipoprotein family protein [Pseudomonadota bacterium]
MTPLLRIAGSIALAAALAGCSLLGGKAPAILYDLTPSVPATGAVTRQAAAGNAVTVRVPVVSKELRTTRVPVQVNPVQVAYVEDLQWVDTPDRLFQDLVSETIRRTTSRVVLDPQQAGLDPGLTVSGELQQFGFDAQRGVAVVRYDATLATNGGASVQTRTFRAELPADGTSATVAPALNAAANQVAIQVAQWIGG